MSAATQQAPVPRLLRFALGVAVLATATGIAVLGAGPAQAATGINSFTMTPSTTQAGGHPDVHIQISWKDYESPPADPLCGCDDARVITNHFPTGFIGNPHAITICTFAQFNTSSCPSDSQVGVVNPNVLGTGFVPLYNMETHPNQAGLLAFLVPVAVAPVFIELSGRTGSDYGLDATGTPIFHPLAVDSLDIYLWGVPADPIHNDERFITPPTSAAGGSCSKFPCANITGAPPNLTPAPYLENPTSCGVPLSSGLDLFYYNGVSLHADSPWGATTGCDLLAFDPSLAAQPTTGQADTASGLDVDVKVKQALSPTTPSPSEIRATTVTLPEGFSINPNAADGKLACTDAQGAFGTTEGAQCPEDSKIGTVEVNSSALPAPIDGAIYLGEPKPGDRYRIFLTADGFGTHVKLAGSVSPDPRTGQLTVSFPDLPQSPFSEFNMHIFGSERGLLATPTQCGTYPVKTDFVPWDTILQNQHTTSFFTISSGPNGQPCPPANRPFNPHLAAGTTNGTAGQHAPFVLDLTRDDGDQNLTGLSVTTPPGFSATLKGIPYCPQAALDKLASLSRSGLAEQASSACPAASQIGTATAGTGAGTHPLYSPGKVYLAGPYKGAPLSLEVVIPAVSGPYDLGNVAVRAALNVDETTAQVSAVSDPLPQILEGIPLRIRSIQVNLDRPGFTLNPTNCDPFSVDATVLGDQGAVASPSTHFQVANCADLGFAPKLSLRLSGGTKRNGHPAIHAVFEPKPGDANTKGVSVALPKGELLDNAHLQNVCAKTLLSAHRCPPGSVLGSARAVTPLLEKPLEGPVYLVSGYGHPLPDVVADLKGQLEILLDGRIDTVHGGLRTTFATVPDVPVTRFNFDLSGGAKGLIVNERDTCKGLGPAVVKIAAQNGRSANQDVALNPSCGKARHKRHVQRTRKAG